MSLWTWAVGPRRCAPRIAHTQSCEIETTKKENAFSRGTAQVTTAETGCGSCLSRVYELCRRASSPVARFWGLEGQNTFLGGHDFCFYDIFKTNFSGNKKIWGNTKEIWGKLPLNALTWLRTYVRLEFRTPWFVRQKQEESKIHSALEQRSSQLQKQFSQMSLRIREQSSAYTWRTPSGWKVRNYLYSFCVIFP